MYVESLSFKNLRNLKDASFNLGKNINILSGQNAQGKTNFLESIYFCSTGRSHRTYLHKELINFEKKDAYIRLIVNNESIKDNIHVHLTREQKKGIAVNNIPVKKLGELFGVVLVVIFSPEDLNLVKLGPSERRKFMDIELCQLKKVYYNQLQEYYHILKQRNNLLKELKKNNNLKESIFIWDEQLVYYGLKIIENRENFINKINEISKKIHFNITNKKEELNVLYKPNVKKEDFLEKLKKNLDKDIIYGSTSVGIHKDDIIILVNDMDVKTYGSQGQQRTSSLSIKLAEIDLIESEKKTSPILLLDDVFSELDESRQIHLISHIKEIQTIITCTGIEEIVNKIPRNIPFNAYNVIKGEVFIKK